MSADLSERARAILEAAERAATERPGVEPSPPPSPPTPVPGPPRGDWSVPAPGPGEPVPIPITAPGQLLAIIDAVVHAAEGARRRLDELAETLEELTRRVDAAGRGPATGAEPPELEGSGLGARPRPPAPSARPPKERASETAHASARLVAVEMAAAGATRMEADRRLRDEFGFRDTRPVLDDVYGPGSAPGARLSPPAAAG
jgi:hypothetical protein